MSRTNKQGSAFKSLFMTAYALGLFLVAFIAFMLAPLLLIAVIAGGMYMLERASKNKKRPTRGVAMAPPTLISPTMVRPSGSTLDGPDPSPNGFGGRAGENL